MKDGKETLLRKACETAAQAADFTTRPEDRDPPAPSGKPGDTAALGGTWLSEPPRKNARMRRSCCFDARYSFPCSLRRFTQSSFTTPRERATNSASAGTSFTTVLPAAR